MSTWAQQHILASPSHLCFAWVVTKGKSDRWPNNDGIWDNELSHFQQKEGTLMHML